MTLKKIKIRRRSLFRAKFCPKCTKQMETEKSSIGGWLVPNEYTCNNCGYKGIGLEKE